jgi:lipopolysaccharide transport system ATP-binding protein
MTKVIQVKNLGKCYWKAKTREQEFVTLRDQLLRWQRPQREKFWALQNVNFDLVAGKVLGVIGRNGAGKSTLFKLLSRITKPTTGEIIIEGRVASMLEVGTGFHPELSGRENIFLNGAILGMSQSETAAKFDDIVKFSGVANFLEDPVKYYSSGMYMRLAFAIAAFLNSEIMIIDEILAVGDRVFQQQCLRKIQSLVRDEGRTILLVSHNLDSVRQFCDHCLWLEAGQVKMFGAVAPVLRAYQRDLR